MPAARPPNRRRVERPPRRAGRRRARAAPTPAPNRRPRREPEPDRRRPNRTRSRSATRRPGASIRTVAVTEAGEIDQKLDGRAGPQPAWARAAVRRAGGRAAARSAICSRPRPTSARSSRRSEMGKPIRQSRNEVRGGARADRLEHRRTSGDVIAPAHGHEHGDARGAHHVRAARRRRPRQRVELSVLRRARTRSCPRCSPGNAVLLQAVGARDAHRAAHRRPAAPRRRAGRRRARDRRRRADRRGARRQPTSTWCASPARTRPASGCAAPPPIGWSACSSSSAARTPRTSATTSTSTEPRSPSPKARSTTAGSRAARPSASTCTRRSGTRSSTRSSTSSSGYQVGDPDATTRTDVGPLARARAARRARRAGRRRDGERGAQGARAAGTASSGRATGSRRRSSSTSTDAMALMRDESLRSGHRRRVVGRRRRSDRRGWTTPSTGSARRVFTARPRARRADPRRARRRQRLLEHRRPLERAAAVGRPPPLGPRRVDVGVGRPQLRAREGLAPRAPLSADAEVSGGIAPGRAVGTHRVVEDLAV